MIRKFDTQGCARDARKSAYHGLTSASVRHTGSRSDMRMKRSSHVADGRRRSKALPEDEEVKKSGTAALLCCLDSSDSEALPVALEDDGVPVVGPLHISSTIATYWGERMKRG